MSTQKILIIDDERLIQGIGRVTYARTLEEGIELLYSTNWDDVYLDHDLGERETIMPLIHLIEEDAYNGTILPVGRFIVHTGNPVGAWDMMSALRPWYNVFRGLVTEVPGKRDPIWE